MEGSLCFPLKFLCGTEESSSKEFRFLLASEDSHFTPHKDLGSVKVKKHWLFILIFSDQLITFLEKHLAVIQAWNLRTRKFVQKMSMVSSIGAYVKKWLYAIKYNKNYFWKRGRHNTHNCSTVLDTKPKSKYQKVCQRSRGSWNSSEDWGQEH